MPSLKKKTASEQDDSLRRAPNKSQAPSEQEQQADEKAQNKIVGDRLDYSRFRGIGQDDKDERIQTGNADWDDLNHDQKKQVWEAEEHYDHLIDKKRQEEDEWRRQLKEKPADLSWVNGRHFASYEAFCVGRVEGTLKKSGNDAYKSGDFDKARMDWDGGVEMLLALGTLPPEALALICTLRNNLAQVYVKQEQWNKVKELTDKILDQDPKNEKALYRRAQALYAFSIWDKAEQDLEVCVKGHPENVEALKMLEMVRKKLGRDKEKLGGKAVSNIAAGLEELCPDGTVRKLRIEEYGEGDPDAKADWVRPEYLCKGRDKVVVTCQMTIWSVGGEELYNSKQYRPHPETKKEREELKEYMDMVNFLDQEANKAPRLVGDFYRKVKKRPVRWYVGDPGMYKGFDLAVRTMKTGERALFEIDQPMLNDSVEEFYSKSNFHSGIAGLPQLVYTIEEERLAILADEIPEDELDLDHKTQRGVRCELQLLGHVLFRDSSANGDGAKLHGVLHPGLPDTPVIQRGDVIRGCFFINRPFDGSMLVQNTFVEWRLGEDEGRYDKQGENNEPLRPDGGAFVPQCVGDAILQVDWQSLRHGALVEVRLRIGPELHEIAPQYKAQFEAARRDNHRKGRRGGGACSILVQVYPPDYVVPEEDAEGARIGSGILDDEVPADLEIE